MKTRLLLFANLFFLLNTAGQVNAQPNGGWNAFFTVQPYPSSYFSDWQNNPSIASLTILNGTGTQQQVKIYFTISMIDGRQVISANSDLIILLPGTNLLNNTVMLRGSLNNYNAAIKDQVIRTGRIPEGTYIVSITIKTTSGATVVTNSRANFTIVYPDPPRLVFPANSSAATGTYPVFQWTPIQVPIQYQLHYVLKIAEVLQGQTPLKALTSNILQYENDNLTTTTLQYPISALPLKSGKTYAWQVLALDQNGFPPSTNSGKSEVWTFTYNPFHMIVLHPILPPPPLKLPPPRLGLITTSTVTGSLYGTFTPPGNGNNSAVKWPLANVSVGLLTQYVLVVNSGNNRTELVIPPTTIISYNSKYTDADRTVASTTTDASGNFSFSFTQTDSTGLIAKNVAFHTHSEDMTFGNHTGDVYKVYRIMVTSPYYLSPSNDIIVQPFQTNNAGSLPALVKTYKMKIEVKPTTVFPNLQQITTSGLAGVTVYLLKQKRPTGATDHEGYPEPASSKKLLGMQVVSENLTDNNGQVKFSDLVQNIEPHDEYFIYAVTDSTSNLRYSCFLTPFGFNGNQWNPGLAISPGFINSAIFNNEYVIPTVSTTFTMMPLLPRIAGNIYRKDNPNVIVSQAQVQLLGKDPTTEASQPTLSDGSFIFNNLQPTADKNSKISGPIWSLKIKKYGFKDMTVEINKRSPLKFGQQVYLDKILLDPAANVSGKVVDEQGNPVQAKVTIGTGETVVANQPAINPATGATIKGNNGFQSPAVLGSHMRIFIDPTPYNTAFFPDTEYVNITRDNQNLGTFIVFKKLHRIDVEVTTSEMQHVGGSEGVKSSTQNTAVPIGGAHVTIKSVGSFLTNYEGTVDTAFVSAGSNFIITVTAPDNKDYEAQTLSAHIPNSKGWTQIYVDLKKASHVSGKVLAGNSPIVGARVFLNESQSPNEAAIETYTDKLGRYVLHDLPIGSSITINAAKSVSQYIGDSRNIKLSASGIDTLNFNLKVYNGMDITKLMGFPIEVDSLNESGSNVSISGNITSLPTNNVFGPSNSAQKVQFHNISIVPGSKKDNANVPYAVPKSLPMITDVNSIPLKIYGTMAGALIGNNAGINITDAGNSLGQFAGLTCIDAASFTSDQAFSNIQLPKIYLGLPGESNLSKKLLVPSIAASGSAPSSIQNGLQISDNKGNSLHYSLYGFDAAADSSASIANGDTVRLLTTIHSNLDNVPNPDINLNIGNVVLHSKKFDPINGKDTISIALENWQIKGSQWSFSGSSGLTINTGQLAAGTVNVPFADLLITSTALKYGNFQTNSMSLAGILPLTITGKLYFGFDQGRGHWSIAVAPKGGSSNSAYLANLPGAATSDQVSINNFFLLSDGTEGFTIDGTAPPLTYYKAASFSPTMLDVYSNYVHIPGTMNLQIPGLKSQSCSIDYSKPGGTLTSKLEAFPFSLDVAGVHLAFPADQNHPETLDSKGFFAKGTISETGKYNFDVWLYRTPDSTSIWTVPNQVLNISQNGATRLTNVLGSMNVSNNNWNNFWFAGDMTGANGASGRLKFIVYGDIIADNQQLGVKNISTPFGNIKYTYDFQKHVLEGSLHIDQTLAGAKVEGDANSIVDGDGWYFLAGASLSLPTPHIEGSAAIVFGNHPMDNSIVTLVQKYSWFYQHYGNLPKEFPSTVSGFYFEGAISLPVPVIPSFDFNFGLVSAKLWANIGGDVRLSMLFSGNGNNYSAGINIFADVGAGVGASIGIACGGMSAEVLADVFLDGQFQSNGNWYVDGGADLTLTGSTYCGFGLCDANCGGSLCDKNTLSASLSLGITGHYGTDGQSIKFYFK